ncbi:MAG TPA: AMP-binding protein [Microvirga sp.]|jgi:acetyl-CoA synthetase|nr:AMP-binding protein [Microvirga sp.]
MLEPTSDYDTLVAAFRWRIPDRYNIGVDVCDRWAAVEPDRPAILEVGADGRVAPFTYGALHETSNRLADALRARGVGRGDRVALLLPQGAAVAVVHVAVYKLGAVALPLAALFGVDAIEYRLKDAGAKAIVTNAAGLAKLKAIGDLPDLGVVVSTDGPDGPAAGFAELLEAGRPDFAPVDTAADDPAMMIYTSGTTGPPKGALHAHRVLLGHLPGVQMPHEFLPQAGDRLWTPADWAWAGGLLNILLPGLHFGVPVVARKAEKFDPEEAFRLMADHGVRNTFVPPTALRMLRTVPNPAGRFDLKLRTVASGGEALGAETFAWGREALGLTINEFYGQTECNLVLASCAAIGVARAGAIGRPVPGHRVAVIREDGSRCEPDEIGQIAVRRPDPVMFLSYWNKPGATEAKFVGDWMTTGDQGRFDGDGYVHFVGRDDDVITSAGYRIGPGEIEDCLIRHPAVALAAAVGKPDPLRTEIVKAFVVLKEGQRPSDALAADIQAFVRARLSAHEYPREIAFRTHLPLTTTGKVIRRLLRDEA